MKGIENYAYKDKLNYLVLIYLKTGFGIEKNYLEQENRDVEWYYKFFQFQLNFFFLFHFNSFIVFLYFYT